MALEIHLIGIGGVGMSALAQVYLDMGYTVTGADRAIAVGKELSPVLQALKRQGVRLFPDDGTGITPDTTQVVISTAVEETNAGLQRARELNIPVIHRAPALAKALAGKKLVAVAGTCGKSTVTAILGHILAECGLDPQVVNGAQIVGWDKEGARVGSVRRGNGEYVVVEVDESDKSLMVFEPSAAIITNASADHYSKEEMDLVFNAFVAKVSGPVVDGRFDEVVPSTEAKQIPLLGFHNRVNAEMALRMAVALGVSRSDVANALRTFPGVERRLQAIGEMTTGAMVYDDYAHNTEKLHAMLITLQELYSRGVAVLWRPHGYGPLRKMLHELIAMFNGTLRPQDWLFLLPVYDAGGTADRSINVDALARDMRQVTICENISDAKKKLREVSLYKGAVVVAGARDPDLPKLAHGLVN